MCRITTNFYYALFYENHRGKCINCIYLYISRDNKSLNNFFSLNRFAVVVVGSDNSSRLIFEKLPKKEIHGQVPQISNCNRQALSQFEAQARKGEPPAQNGRKSAQLTPVNKIINDLKSNLNSLLVSIFLRKFYFINSMT